MMNSLLYVALAKHLGRDTVVRDERPRATARTRTRPSWSSWRPAPPQVAVRRRPRGLAHPMGCSTA